MKELKGSQRKYLRGLAHKLNPSVYIGQKGVTQGILDEVDLALDASELIKIKFNDFKQKDQKNELISQIVQTTNAHLAGTVGHVAIVYRQHKDIEKRKITLP